MFLGSKSTTEAEHREEVKEDKPQSPLSPAATHGGEKSEQANSLAVNIEDVEVDAISIETLSDLDVEELD